MFGDLVWTLRPDPDDFGLIAIVAVPRFNVDDFAAVCRVPADVLYSGARARGVLHPCNRGQRSPVPRRGPY